MSYAPYGGRASRNAAAALEWNGPDPTGATVPDATIHTFEHEDRIQGSTASNSTGNPSLVGISPGNHTVADLKEGFSTAKNTEFVPTVDQQATMTSVDSRYTPVAGLRSRRGRVRPGKHGTAELGTVVGQR